MAHVMPRICAAVFMIAAAATARAPRAGTVTGKLDLPASGPPPLRDPAFLDRVENPHMPVRAVDPTPLMVVVLEGTTTAAPPTPGQVTWDLLGASFAKPLVPVVAGTEVVIKNCRACRPASLYVDGQPDLIQKGVLNPIGSKLVKTSKPGVMVVKDEELTALTGEIAVFASPYFAQPDATGAFEIKDVPKGSWTLKVWYADHWIERGNETVTTEDKGKVELKKSVPIPTGFPGTAGK
jgi:hypothetical protein